MKKPKKKDLSKRITTLEMEIALMNHIGVNTHIIVPNLSWAMLNHEADLVVLSDANFASEIEIKITKADLKNDFTKGHCHESSKIKYLYYAVPKFLEEYTLSVIPEHSGLYVVDKSKVGSYKVVMSRSAKPCKPYKKWTKHQRQRLSELGCMRVLTMKKQLNREKYKRLRENS